MECIDTLISHRQTLVTGWFCIGLLQFLESKFGRHGMCPRYGNGDGLDLENQSNQISS